MGHLCSKWATQSDLLDKFYIQVKDISSKYREQMGEDIQHQPSPYACKWKSVHMHLNTCVPTQENTHTCQAHMYMQNRKQKSVLNAQALSQLMP